MDLSSCLGIFKNGGRKNGAKADKYQKPFAKQNTQKSQSETIVSSKKTPDLP